MDLTQGTHQEKTNRAKKMMLWFGIISLFMSFAGLTSAVIISKNRPDWLHDFHLPNAFITSTILILISSITFIIAKRALKRNDRTATTLWLILTFTLGVAFILNQLKGFSQIIEQGYYFTGPSSNVTTSFIFLIAIVHIMHVVVGLISIAVVIYNHFKQKYNATQMLGFELSATFWHFVDVLWLFLFLFFYFIR